jgi:hypothetical protein
MHSRPRGTLRLRWTAAASTEAADDATEIATPPPAPHALAYNKVKMEDIVSLFKRRGIIFPSSKIYNGFAGFFEYVPSITTERLRRGSRSQRLLHSVSPAVTAVARGACGMRRRVRTPVLT